MRTEPAALRLGFQGEEFSYAIDMGLPIPSLSAFSADPEIKTEVIWHGRQLRPASQLVERRNALVRIRRGQGEWDVVTSRLQPFESMMELIADPLRAAEVLMLREAIRTWRFYDHFRTDAEAPARQLQVGTYTPVLAHDGRDLAAALQTIREIGDATALDTAISDAFPGAALQVSGQDGRLAAELRQHGLLRPLGAAELSDGTFAIFVADRGTTDTAAAAAHGPERTGVEPASRPAARASAIDRGRGEVDTDIRGVACSEIDCSAAGECRMRVDRAGKGAQRNQDRGAGQAGGSCLALVEPVAFC